MSNGPTDSYPKMTIQKKNIKIIARLDPYRNLYRFKKEFRRFRTWFGTHTLGAAGFGLTATLAVLSGGETQILRRDGPTSLGSCCGKTLVVIARNTSCKS
jgi:hypothetical protein